MEQYEAILSIISLSMGIAWASGINLYAVLLALGIGGFSGQIALPEELQILQDPLIIGAAGFMYSVEFFADKIPGVDTGWDGLHTFIRIPAAALLASGAIGDVSAPLELAAAIVGGGLAAGTHATKAGSRVLINTSPEPFSNWFASIGEDILAFAALWTAFNHPLIFLTLLTVSIGLMIYLLPKLIRGIRTIFRKITQLLGFTKEKLHSR